MIYRILKDGQEVNAIVADPVFVAAYCEKYGYTYELVREAVAFEDEPTELEQMRADIDYIAMQTGVEL